jgi:hypothetical protein
MAPTTIPAGTGAHTTLQSGQSIKIINPSGHQVIDCWAFPLAADTRPRWMSMAQSRSALGKVIPSVGDTLIDTHRQPVVTLTSDTSPGIHDMLFPACDSWRYIRGYLPSPVSGPHPKDPTSRTLLTKSPRSRQSGPRQLRHESATRSPSPHHRRIWRRARRTGSKGPGGEHHHLGLDPRAPEPLHERPCARREAQRRPPQL